MLRQAIIIVLLAAPALAASRQEARRAADDARALFERNAATRPAQWAVESGRGRRFEASMIFVAAAPKMTTIREWVMLGPMPPEHASVRDLKVTSGPAHSVVHEKTGARRPMLLWRITPADIAARYTTLNITYTLEIVPRRLAPRGRGAAAPAELSADDRAAFTAAGSLTDFESEAFFAWLTEQKLRPQRDETDIDFARRAFLHIKAKAGFEFKASMDRRASAVCKSMKSDCAGLTALYVATLRGNGIPARQLVGRWAQSAKKGEKLDQMDYQQEHVKSEFFAAGVGWVPVDISVAVDFDKVPGSLREFGRDDGEMLLMHIDPDMRLDSIHHGPKTVPFLQGPQSYCQGTGSMDGNVWRSDWQVKAVRR